MSPIALIFLLLSFAATASAARPAFACGAGSPALGLPFCRTSLPIHERVQDLVKRLTVDEKVKVLVNNAAGVPRLGISSYEWWSEALHGVANTDPGVTFGGSIRAATSFPQVITTAASFNASLWELIGKVVSDEARAMYNEGQAGLTFWSPNVNIFRDPRWGRGQETPGEDPTVAGRYAVAYVRGLQQPFDLDKLKVAACCKHFTAYDLEDWNGFDRFHFNAKVSQQDLEDTFNVPFKSCVSEGRVASVMCSYNQVNGIPSCADQNLLRNTLRGQWKLDGYIVSDCGAVAIFNNFQHYTRSPEDAVAATLKAGLDLECGSFLAQYTGSALRKGKVSEADINTALTNSITVQMRLGMYDGEPSKQTYGYLGPQHVCTKAHQDLALEAARQGIVLLKNDANTLPLSPSRLGVVAVVGPNSDATTTMIGNYNGIPCHYTSPLQGIEKYVKVVHQMGCLKVSCIGNQPIEAAVNAARNSDATILVVGLDQSVEAEGRDRTSLLLPGQQPYLVSKVAQASKGPVVLVIMSGGPVDVSFANNDPKITAILWAGYPGQAGGTALADIIFGAFNPSGKLPMTWYPQEYITKVPMTSMAMRANPSTGYPGRTHRFYNGPVVYPYGHGLSYSKFGHSIANAPAELLVRLNVKRTTASNSSEFSRTVRVSHAECDGLNIPIHVDVKNYGEFGGSHTVFVYSVPPAGHGSPRRQLVGFEKVSVAAGQEVRVVMDVDVCRDLSFADIYGVRRIFIGEHSLHIGELKHSVSLSVAELV